jgi:hypothetical protein
MTVFAPLSTTTWRHVVAASSAGSPPSRVVGAQVDRGRVDARALAQPFELARVGRQHGRPHLADPPLAHRRHGPQRLGIEDHRRRRRVVVRDGEQHPHELPRREARSEPRPHHDRVVLMVEDPGDGRLRIDLLDVVLGQRHRGRLDDLRGEQWLQGFRHREGDEAGPGSAGRAADEQRRAA